MCLCVLLLLLLSILVSLHKTLYKKNFRKIKIIASLGIEGIFLSLPWVGPGSEPGTFWFSIFTVSITSAELQQLLQLTKLIAIISVVIDPLYLDINLEVLNCDL